MQKSLQTNRLDVYVCMQNASLAMRYRLRSRETNANAMHTKYPTAEMDSCIVPALY